MDTTAAIPAGKARTITLTGRPPVRIAEADWPVVASAGWADYDGQYEFQANRKARATIRVRAHADGRRLVYGVYTYDTQFQGERDARAAAGVLLAAPAGPLSAITDVTRAITDVTGTLAGYESLPAGWQPDWALLAADAVADLPATDL